ncbi:MAG: beta-N-acetylhexosaminidase, partial [Myxococcales bacterium]|nr:beta-N-acetylhexosaminidase [Myxococcales bacterium]
QEGGRVQRLKAPLTVLPPMLHVGNTRDPNVAVAVGQLLGDELAALGFNLDFAPVADVWTEPANQVIGDRAFATEPERAAQMAGSLALGLTMSGVIACAKHFPGHGDTAVDSHLALPVVEREEPDLRHTELPPFRAAVEAGVGTMMSSHVVYPAWDEELPATLSPRILPRLLREELGYDGVVFSDDLEMKAVAGRWTVEEQVRYATDASIDVMLCCRDPGLQVRVYEELVRAMEEDRRWHRASEDATGRVKRLRERFLLGRAPDPDLSVVGTMEHKVLAELARARGA